jgi:hypothetical protein
MEDIFGPAADAPEYYIDSVRMALGLYTITLELGTAQVQDTPSSQPPPIKRVAMVRMSPQHALIFSRLLQKNVDIYQTQFGKINIPPDVFKSMNLDPE